MGGDCGHEIMGRECCGVCDVCVGYAGGGLGEVIGPRGEGAIMTSVERLWQLGNIGRWDGRRWYRHARGTIGRVCRWYGLGTEWFSDVLAIMSPRTTVSRNLKMAVRYCVDGVILPDVTLSVQQALRHYQTTGEIRGPKTSAFARVLRGDNSAVVIDTHMLRAAGLPDRPRVGEREELIGRVERVARRMGTDNATAQASIWCGYYWTEYRNGKVPYYRAELVLPSAE